MRESKGENWHTKAKKYKVADASDYSSLSLARGLLFC